MNSLTLSYKHPWFDETKDEKIDKAIGNLATKIGGGNAKNIRTLEYQFKPDLRLKIEKKVLSLKKLNIKVTFNLNPYNIKPGDVCILTEKHRPDWVYTSKIVLVKKVHKNVCTFKDMDFVASEYTCYLRPLIRS